MDGTRDTGSWGERIAALHLQDGGFEIVARNVRLPNGGELDIVAQREGLLVLVEVKTSASGSDPLEMMTPRKVRKFLETARLYVSMLPVLPEEVRLDVMGVVREGEGWSVVHVEGAVECSRTP